MSKLSLRKQAYICWTLARSFGWLLWRDLVKGDSDACGCGISWLWMLPKDHPFAVHVPKRELLAPCPWHDNEYIWKMRSRKDADLGFYQRMLLVAEELEE